MKSELTEPRWKPDAFYYAEAINCTSSCVYCKDIIICARRVQDGG